MAGVEQHTDELDGEPVSWRATDVGSAPNTVYLHGGLDDSQVWLPFLERTGGVALDLPGFGGSVKAVTFPYSIAGYEGFLERFLDWLGLERVNLVMHDWGAAGLSFAKRAPERVERVVLINALPLFDGYPWRRPARTWRTPVLGELWMGSLTPRLLRRALRDANAAPLPDRELRRIYTGLDFGTQRAILKLYRSATPGTLAAAGAGLDQLTAAALIVWGELDPFNPPRAAAQYAAALGGECETLSLPDAGHWPWLDRPELIERVADFIAPS
ncbi:MAG TPA: alpha/beta hydrolase [Solirubrobacteraceae bacterium]|nr:alpha/beta hydrolase [Solirubrobacteraceae bacterium]